MFKTALLPVDFTESGALFWDFAAGASSLGVRRLIIVHVVDASGMEGPVIMKEVEEVRARLRERAARLEKTGMLVDVRVPAGDPFDELLGLSHERQIEGLILGSHGKRLTERLLAGSVSERLLTHAGKPTLCPRYALLENAADPADVARDLGRTVVLATDFSRSARRAFDMLVDAPRGVVRRMHIVHVYDRVLSGARRERIRQGAAAQLDDLADIARSQGLTATVGLREGSATAEIVHEIDRVRATGVVLGSRGRSPVEEALLGSVSMDLLRQASAPVVVVP